MTRGEIEIRENVEALITSFAYNMDTTELVECIKCAIHRLNGDAFYEHKNLAIDLIVSFLVVRYGDYGTSPRLGWFPAFERRCICKELAQQIAILTKEGDND